VTLRVTAGGLPDQKVVCSNHAGCGDPVIRNSVPVIFGALEA
jgi:hypothetical protein